MTGAKHTPGPWVPEDGGGKGSWIKSEVNGEWAALACGSDDLTAEANADLIAAAPDLLKALKYIVAECDEDMDDDYNPHAAPLANARAAIAKAEGVLDVADTGEPQI